MDYHDHHRHRHRRRYDDDEQLNGRRHHDHSHRRRRKSHRKPSESVSSSQSDEDQKGLIEFKTGEKIDNRYEIVRVAGQGTFGTVLECLDRKHGMRRVAVKAVRSVERYLDAAGIEIDILRKLAEKDVDGSSLCVRLLSWFSARHHRREHMFLVFEYLGRDLYTFMKRNRHAGFALELVRSFAYQLLKAVAFCHSLKLCHTDLKPENILLCSNDYTVCRRTKLRIPASTAIRLIDFGGATFEHERHSRTIATRQYRAPEVIFGLPWSYPADIWSLGCIFAELLSGSLLFNTHEDLEHLALMQRVLGKEFPQDMVSRALEPFRSGSGSAERAARQRKARRGRSNDPIAIDLLSMSRMALRWPDAASSTDSINHVSSYPVLDEIVPYPLLADLIRKLLQFDPSDRLTARQAMKHPFFTTTEHLSFR